MAEYQKELFQEYNRRRTSLEKIRDKITRRRRMYIHVPLENIVFITIVGIMCVIVAFAFGVERGKRLAKIVTAFNDEDISLPEIEIKLEAVKHEEREKESASIADKPYTVQLISFKDERRAIEERDGLLAEGIDAFLIPSGNWYQVCAGYFDSMNDANSKLKSFSERYVGCFIRRR